MNTDDRIYELERKLKILWDSSILESIQRGKLQQQVDKLENQPSLHSEVDRILDAMDRWSNGRKIK